MNNCSICGLGDGCLYTVRECSDHAHPATKKQVIDRLDSGYYKNDTETMIKFLSEKYNFNYTLVSEHKKDDEMLDMTKGEAYAAAELIDKYMIDSINDYPVDSVQWLRNLVHAYEKLCAYSGYVGATETKPPKKEGENDA